MSEYEPSFDYWLDAIDGVPEKDRCRVPKNKVPLGFWRKQQRDGTFIGLATWADDQGRVCVKVAHAGSYAFTHANKEEDFSENMMAWCKPVTEEAYREWMASGRWPDEVGRGSNTAAAAPEVVLSETINDLVAEAKAWLAEIGGAPRDQSEADKAANYKTRFAALEKEAETARVAGRKPHMDAAAEVQRTWAPIEAAANQGKRWAGELAQRWLAAEQAKRLKAAAEAAARGEGVKAADMKVKAGTTGRAVSLRTRADLVFTDYDAIFAHYQTDDRFRLSNEVTRAISKLAREDIEAGRDVPGAKLETSSTAA